jgi:heme-degrading monooxygenase HmoA
VARRRAARGRLLRGGCAGEVTAAVDATGRSCQSLGMVVVTNRIPVAAGHEIDFEDRFKKRVHLVDKSPGFVRNEVHRPKPMKFDHEAGWIEDKDAQGYYEVKTWWRSFEDFVAWTKSPAFAEAHKNRAPKEMFAGPNVLEVHEVFTSTDLEV